MELSRQHPFTDLLPFVRVRGVVLHCLWAWVTSPLIFCGWVHFSLRKTDSWVRSKHMSDAECDRVFWCKTEQDGALQNGWHHQLLCRRDVRSLESSPLKKPCIIQVVSLPYVGRLIGSAFKLDTLYHHQTPAALNFTSGSHVRNCVENLTIVWQVKIWRSL